MSIRLKPMARIADLMRVGSIVGFQIEPGQKILTCKGSGVALVPTSKVIIEVVCNRDRIRWSHTVDTERLADRMITVLDEVDEWIRNHQNAS